VRDEKGGSGKAKMTLAARSWVIHKSPTLAISKLDGNLLEISNAM